MNLKHALKAAVILAALGAGSAALATPITYDLTATLTSKTGTFSGLALGSAVQVVLTVDTSVFNSSIIHPNEFIIQDDLTSTSGPRMVSATVSVGGHSYSASPTLTAIADDIETLGGAPAQTFVGMDSQYLLQETRTAGRQAFELSFQFNDFVDQLAYQSTGAFPTMAFASEQNNLTINDGVNNGSLGFSPFKLVPAFAPVPEPLTAGLFGVSLLALAFKRRKSSNVEGNPIDA